MHSDPAKKGGQIRPAVVVGKNMERSATIHDSKPKLDFTGFDPKRLYSTAQVADGTGQTTSYYEAARQRGDGPAYIKLGKRTVKYTGQAILDWLTAGQRRNTSQGGGNV